MAHLKKNYMIFSCHTFGAMEPIDLDLFAETQRFSVVTLLHVDFCTHNTSKLIHLVTSILEKQSIIFFFFFFL